MSPNLVSLFFHLFFFPFSTCSHSLPAPIPTFPTTAFSSFSFPISYFSSGLSSVHLTPSHNACNSAQVSWTPRTVCVHCTIASPNRAWESSRRVYWCHSRDVEITLPEHIYVAGTFKHLDKLLLILLPRTREELFPAYWGACLERFSDLPKVTVLVNSRASLQSRSARFQMPSSFIISLFMSFKKEKKWGSEMWATLLRIIVLESRCIFGSIWEKSIGGKPVLLPTCECQKHSWDLNQFSDTQGYRSRDIWWTDRCFIPSANYCCYVPGIVLKCGILREIKNILALVEVASQWKETDNKQKTK